ncbi:hypothetical protein [Agrobacterium sp. ST15.13.015]|uniref:hypothetical protein n=1 Tax=Agrobacterium sp. ST15.13.015 TaxID=3017319 RepID=UPI0022C02CD0|nr:hypothetical protein [Agrobacterium sp. ST15.13.015]MCZ7498870.1 hypothetical protein [Rhizobium rhizogenes]
MRRSDAIAIAVLALILIAICALAIISQLDVSRYDATLNSSLKDEEFAKKAAIANIALLQAQIYWAAFSAFLAGLGSLATAAGIIFVAAQLRVSRQQLNRDRAYVHYDGLKWLSFSADGVNTDNWGLFPRWINSGGTPALQMECWYGADWLQHDQFPDFDATRMEGHKTTLRPGGQIEMSPVFIKPAEIEVPRHNHSYCIWGEVNYRDIFFPETNHVTRFCVKLLGYNGDPKLDWSADKNPVNLHFGNMGPNFAT